VYFERGIQMSEPNAYLDNNSQSDVYKDGLVFRLIRLVGSIVSLLILGLIIYWTVSLYKRDINDLPIVTASQIELRSKPLNPGGKKVNYKGLSVNSVIAKEPDRNEFKDIKLAPSGEALAPSEKEPAVLLNKTGEVNDSMAGEITRALESFLNISPAEKSEKQEIIELHLGTFESKKKADAYWILLREINQDLLSFREHKITQSDLTKESYRLRLTGFKSASIAKDLCEKLLKRGEKCVPAREE
jgi:hypothetical protein